MADDLGWNDVGFHGNNVISTPNIDALAYSGVILNNYYVQPLCTPSRSAFLTGMYPIHTGLQDLVIRAAAPYGLPLNYTLFPHYLKGLGYSTRIVGKWHLGNFRKEYTPTFRDFDSHYGYWTGVIDYFNYTYAYEPNGYSGYDFRRNFKIEYPKIGTYATDLLTEESVKIINEHDPSKPLFLYLAQLAPHVGNPGARLQAPEEVIQRFSYIEDKDRRVYAAMLWKLDESVGRVTKALQDNNMLDNSIIVFTTDNGGGSGEQQGSASTNWPLRGSKGTVYEGGVRGSAFVWSSLLNDPGRVSMEMMHITDWFPTLYHAIGGSESVLPKMDGMNVWNSIQGNSPSPRNEFVININPIFNLAGIRVDDWKLFYNPIDLPTQEPKFNSWFGPSERNFPRNNCSCSKWNDFKDVKNSLAGRTVQKLMPNIFKNIHKIRKNAEVLCTEVPENATATCNDPSNPCLFNVASDPCEYFDVSKSHPAIVKLLLNRLQFYNSTAIPPGNKPEDPRANPIFWNNTWINWFDYLDQNSYLLWLRK
ncbi:Arylsulfatase B [Armadillidium nasatum]|uniref:Arylsulfatase B n=1 Tax=Armadillidium nasatum TaxID=96803 RepID=A0A5N5TH16_9CRUS|nr:Arylsulfatase B [Armadillidium nasatum]